MGVAGFEGRSPKENVLKTVFRVWLSKRREMSSSLN